jgi:AraC-like DNA-binding protein
MALPVAMWMPGPEVELYLSALLLSLSAMAALGIFQWAARFRKRISAPESTPEHVAHEIPRPPQTPPSQVAPIRVVNRDVMSPAPNRMRTGNSLQEASPLPFLAAKPPIFVAVNDAFVRSELHHQLTPRYSVVEADDTIDTIELAKILQPALIITAAPMNESGGCALCDQLKAEPALKDVPLLWIAPAAGLPSVEDFNVSAEDTLTGALNNESLPIRVENLVEVRQYVRHGGLPAVRLSSDDSASRLADTLFLDAVHRLVDDNIGNSLFGLEALAREAQVPLPHLESRLLRLTQLSAAGFLRTKRLIHALDLLREGKPPAEVASLTGFHSTGSFSRLFKQVMGVLPEDYSA